MGSLRPNGATRHGFPENPSDGGELLFGFIERAFRFAGVLYEKARRRGAKRTAHGIDISDRDFLGPPLFVPTHRGGGDLKSDIAHPLGKFIPAQSRSGSDFP